MMERRRREEKRSIKSLVNHVINALPFALHLPGCQYCGPGMKRRERLVYSRAERGNECLSKTSIWRRRCVVAGGRRDEPENKIWNRREQARSGKKKRWREGTYKKIVDSLAEDDRRGGSAHHASEREYPLRCMHSNDVNVPELP